ncbi:MAG TPA: hypothetical protein DCE80_14945 [Ignavibacteriales bacterium]|nr:hypothetical protein [Ignavibacteriales bacterium]
MIKQFFCFLLLTFNLLSLTYLYAGWPVNRTPRIEGKVIDATTGKPIENAVVSAEWIKQKPAMLDTVYRGFSHYVTITDKDGKYVIPAKITIHMASSFWSLPIQIIHPLYESQGFGCVCRKLDRFDLKSEHKQYQGKYGIIVSGPSDNRFDYDLYVEKDGVVHYDVKLLSLEERYVKPMKMGTEKTLGFLSTMRNQKFLLDIYKQKNKKIDIDAISKTYKKWLKDFPESQELRHSVEEFENEAIKYRHWMGENE